MVTVRYDNNDKISYCLRMKWKKASRWIFIYIFIYICLYIKNDCDSNCNSYIPLDSLSKENWWLYHGPSAVRTLWSWTLGLPGSRALWGDPHFREFVPGPLYGTWWSSEYWLGASWCLLGVGGEVVEKWMLLNKCRWLKQKINKYWHNSFLQKAPGSFLTEYSGHSQAQHHLDLQFSFQKIWMLTLLLHYTQ